jgi:hypothetical protein
MPHDTRSREACRRLATTDAADGICVHGVDEIVAEALVVTFWRLVHLTFKT